MSRGSLAGGGIYAKLDSSLGAMELAAALLAAVLMLVAMVLVSIDAVARYGFNAPLTFQHYYTENYLLVAIITMSMAWGFRTGSYIRIMALAQRLQSGHRRLLLRAGLLVSATYIGTIDWPISWSWIWIPVGCGLLALRVLLTTFGPADLLHVEHDPVDDAV